jgi:hypothetical protein
MTFILILAILLWLGGYFMTARKMSNTEVLSDYFKIIISPPKWIYFLCGSPTSNMYPKGTMRVVAFNGQILGIALGIYVIWCTLVKPSVIEKEIGFALSTVVTIIITYYASKHYVTKNLSIRQKRKK